MFYLPTNTFTVFDHHFTITSLPHHWFYFDKDGLDSYMHRLAVGRMPLVLTTACRPTGLTEHPTRPRWLCQSGGPASGADRTVLRHRGKYAVFTSNSRKRMADACMAAAGGHNELRLTEPYCEEESHGAAGDGRSCRWGIGEFGNAQMLFGIVSFCSRGKTIC